jgi:glycosyltransferase involved in cell wall biosynthesis
VSTLVVVNGPATGALAERASWVARAAGGAPVLYRPSGRVRGVLGFLVAIGRRRPAVVYAVDCAVATVLAAVTARALFGARVVLDTGDATGALVQSSGQGGAVGTLVARVLERVAYRAASVIVVRSHGLARHVRRVSGRTSVVVPDGFDPGFAGVRDGAHLRRRWGLADDALAVAVLGSARWNARRQWCYGRDVIEVVSRCQRDDVVGVLLVSGDGVPRLRDLARRLDVMDRVMFIEPSHGAEGWDQLAAIDVALSTQTNDAVGQARTTGKLVQYMAAGKFVIASRVGTAADVLPAEMLVDYHGAWDAEYFARVAGVVDALPGRAAVRDIGARLVSRSAPFSYEALVRTLQADVLCPSA